MRNKAVNYYLHKDKLLFFYDLNYDVLYQPYRLIFYNK